MKLYWSYTFIPQWVCGYITAPIRTISGAILLAEFNLLYGIVQSNYPSVPWLQWRFTLSIIELGNGMYE